MTPFNPIPALALCLTLAAGISPGTVLAADPVYESTDAAGKPSFSDTPGPGATQVELPPGPTPEQVEQAQRAGEKLQRQTPTDAAIIERAEAAKEDSAEQQAAAQAARDKAQATLKRQQERHNFYIENGYWPKDQPTD